MLRIQMILDIVDMCAYCHEEHLKEDPEIVIARVKNDWCTNADIYDSRFS